MQMTMRGPTNRPTCSPLQNAFLCQQLILLESILRLAAERYGKVAARINPFRLKSSSQYTAATNKLHPRNRVARRLFGRSHANWQFLRAFGCREDSRSACGRIVRQGGKPVESLRISARPASVVGRATAATLLFRRHSLLAESRFARRAGRPSFFTSFWRCGRRCYHFAQLGQTVANIAGLIPVALARPAPIRHVR